MADASRRPAAFLDRDGTLIEERNYLADPAGVVLLPGAVRGLGMLHDAGYALVVVTNQSGIARGYFSLADLLAVQARMTALLDAEGVKLDGVWYCPHHPDFTGPCDCRKPALRLFHEAADTLRLDLGRSVFIGDRIQDILPATQLGGTPVLVRTGYGQDVTVELPPGTVVADDILDAAERVLAQQDMVDTGGSSE
ncbi:MAG TPA: HAD family hydrolase [Longimicrobiales bacterium]|nr:HAD family hydrolase [Longimicrobiales bacterium]